MDGVKEFKQYPGTRPEDRCFDHWRLDETDKYFRAYVSGLHAGRLKFAIDPDSPAEWWIVDGDGWAGVVRLRCPESGMPDVFCSVRPGKRGLGYTSEALRQALAIAGAMGYEEASIASGAGRTVVRCGPNVRPLDRKRGRE